MSFLADVLAPAMIEAARATVAKRWPALRPLAEIELRRLAGSLEDVAGLFRSGQIDGQRARKLVQLHALTARSVLTMIEGVSLLTAEEAVRAALDAAGSIARRAGTNTTISRQKEKTMKRKKVKVTNQKAKPTQTSREATKPVPDDKATAEFKAGKDL